LKEKDVEVPCAISLVLSLAFIEPALGRLKKLGDTLKATQYLYIAPTGEISYFFPALREVPIGFLVCLSAPLFLIGIYPAYRRLIRNGLDRICALGWLLMFTGISILALEYQRRGEWVIGTIGVRYLALTMISVGAFLGCRKRKFLATLGLGGFSWDLSSAIFWAYLNKNWRARVPVGWKHHFGDEEVLGAPCWLVTLVDLAGISFFSWVLRSEYDPLRLFD